jgi:hypothetical protein
MKSARMMGRLSSGAESDRGSVVHAVPDEVRQYGPGRALCGAEPGRTSGGWDVDHAAGATVTCLRCASRMRSRARGGSRPNRAGIQFPANAGRPWDAAADARLLELAGDAAEPDVESIAAALGRTKAGITVRLEVLRARR